MLEGIMLMYIFTYCFWRHNSPMRGGWRNNYFMHYQLNHNSFDYPTIFTFSCLFILCYITHFFNFVFFSNSEAHSWLVCFNNFPTVYFCGCDDQVLTTVADVSVDEKQYLIELWTPFTLSFSLFFSKPKHSYFMFLFYPF